MVPEEVIRQQLEPDRNASQRGLESDSQRGATLERVKKLLDGVKRREESGRHERSRVTGKGKFNHLYRTGRKAGREHSSPSYQLLSAD